MFTTGFNLDENLEFEKKENIFYQKAKNPSAKGTILFIHGFTSTYFLHHLFVLNNEFEDYNYLALNLKGHTFSSEKQEKKFDFKKQLKEYDINAYVSELEAYIETHKIYNLTLIGHSMGGGIALLLYEKMKKRINKIILVDAINPAIYRSKIGLKYIFNTFNNKFNELKLIEFKQDLKNEANDDNVEIVNAYVNYEIERFLKRKRSFLFLGVKLIEPSLYAKLNKIYRSINIPVLYIMGKYDKVIPYSYSKKYFRKINNPYITFRTINNSSHVPFVESFDEYNKYVWWFINKNDN